MTHGQLNSCHLSLLAFSVIPNSPGTLQISEGLSCRHGKCKPQEERDNFHLHCKMAFWSDNAGVSSLTTQDWKGPGNVRKGLLTELVEDLVKDTLSNSVRDNPGMNVLQSHLETCLWLWDK